MNQPEEIIIPLSKKIKRDTIRITLQHGASMEFEWDDNKYQQNIAKHGVRFEDAIRIFDGFTVSLIDE